VVTDHRAVHFARCTGFDQCHAQGLTQHWYGVDGMALPQALTVNPPEALRPVGWGDKPGVRIVFGRWQDVLPELGRYDGIFFDTYGEYYEDLRWDSI